MNNTGKPTIDKNQNCEDHEIELPGKSSKKKNDVHTELFTCVECDYQSKKKHDFLRHKTIHTGGKCYKCEYCNVAFGDKRILISHVRTHTGEKPYFCDECGLRSAHSGHISRHKSSKHKQANDQKKVYSCIHCDAEFSLKKTLANHIENNECERPYECAICDYKANCEWKLVIHQKSHKQEGEIKCDQCDATFKHKGSLVYHTKVHTGENTVFSCDQCEKTFHRRQTLSDHKEWHKKQKPQKCDHCQFQCNIDSDLKRHKSVFHGIRT